MIEQGGAQPRNIVAMCDGTSNQVEGNLSNVLKLYQVTLKDERQRVFYDMGVGTIANDSTWGRLKQRATAIWGLATGLGLDDNILDAYRFICLNHRPHDRIMLFGFSRGAYTARALAGLIHMVGLLHPDQINLAGPALNAYKHASEKNNLHLAWDFSRVVGTRRVTIHFVGVWDTVASMIVPRPDRFYLPSLRMLPFTRVNPSVRAFRHAISLDERRRMFRSNRWIEPQPFVEDPFAGPSGVRDQDILQHWFAGVHADVGGGWPEDQSALSKVPLIWMVEQAREHGLLVDEALLDRLGRGLLQEGSVRYVAPDATAQMHNSLKGAWWILEVLPKGGRWRETRSAPLGVYLPFGEPRRIPEGALMDPSVFARMAADPGYRPPGVAAPAPTTSPQALGDGPRGDADRVEEEQKDHG